MAAGLVLAERRVHAVAEHAGQDDEILVRLEARTHRPFHRRFGPDVDAVVDDEDVLDDAQLGEQRLDRLARLAGRCLADRDAQMLAFARRRGDAGVSDVDAELLQDIEGARLQVDGEEVCGFDATEHAARAVQHGLVQGILAHGDRGDVKDGVEMHGPVISHVLAERAFRLDVALGTEIALKDHLGVGRNADIVGQRLDQRHRLAAQCADQRSLVGGDAHGCGHKSRAGASRRRS